MIRRPKAWTAVFLGVLGPGAGHLYAGNPGRGVLVLIVLTVLLVFYGPTLLLIPSALTAPVLVLVLLFFYVVCAVDVWRCARSWDINTPRPFWSRWFVALPVAVGIALAIDYANLRRKTELVEAFRLPSGSMEPTLMVGDYILVDKRGGRRQPALGAVVVHSSVEEQQLKVIRRVVGMPGDTIAMTAGTLLRNGRVVTEQYVAPAGGLGKADVFHRAQMRVWQLPYRLGGADSSYNPDLNDWGPIRVPPDSFFGLGDTRDDSYDSRYYGFVPISFILGRPRYVYFSRAPGGPIRWRRLGQVIE